MTAPHYSLRFTENLPPELDSLVGSLGDLAMDLRWTWSHGGDALWESIAPQLWEQTRNPFVIMQNLTRPRLEELNASHAFREQLQALVSSLEEYRNQTSWYDENRDGHSPQGRRLLQHGVRPGRGPRPVCRRARRAGRRLPQGGKRPGHPAGGRRPVVPGGLFPPDPGRRRPPAGDLLLQRFHQHAHPPHDGPQRRVAADPHRISWAHRAPARLGGAGGARHPVPARQQRPAQQPRRPGNHRQALRRRPGDAPGPGDRTGHRRLAPDRGPGTGRGCMPSQ